MAHTDPTAAVFVADFPEFEDADSGAITRAIAVAKRMVDTSWAEGDYTRAIELYAAHLLTRADQALASGGVSGDIQSESLGPINVSYGKAEKSASDVFGLDATTYGAEFRMLQRLNRGGPRII